MIHVLFQLFSCCNQLICTYCIITLQNPDMYFPKETLRLSQDVIRLLQKFSHQIAAAGHGCVNHNDEFLNFMSFFPFLWFNKRHIAIHPETVAVKYIIKRIRIDLHFFF